MLDIYVGPNTAPTPTGTSPADPLPTLPAAVALADSILAQSPARQGVTINVFPGSYTLTQPLVLPAFGLCIEPYRNISPGAASTVHIDISGIAPSQSGAIQFTQALGAQTAALGNPTTSYAPSEIRGLTISGGSGTAIEINPWTASPPVTPGDVVEVGIHECSIIGAGGGSPNLSRAIYISSTDPASRNVVSDNEILGRVYGIWIHGQGSDIVMRNKIFTANVGIRSDSQGANNDLLHPRVLCNFIGGQDNGPGIWINGGSAFIASNTIAFCTGTITLFGAPGSIIYGANTSVATPSLTVVNNILFSPGVPELDLNPFGVPFQGILTFAFNDIENADPMATGPNNALVPASPFVSTSDLHLATTPSTTANLALAQSGATILFATHLLPVNINVDIDHDSRAHQQLGSPAATMHRGADQFVSDGLRLRYASSSTNAFELADRFGNIRADTEGASPTLESRVALELVLPAQTQSLWLFFVSDMGPSGPDFEQTFLPPFGTAAILPTAIAFASTPPNGQVAGTVSLIANYGVIFPQFLEAETYIQCFVLRTDGTGAFSNRIRVDIDQ